MRIWGNHRITTFQIIALGFVLMILAGTLLLMLPAASREETGTGFSAHPRNTASSLLLKPYRRFKSVPFSLLRTSDTHALQPCRSPHTLSVHAPASRFRTASRPECSPSADAQGICSA